MHAPTLSCNTSKRTRQCARRFLACDPARHRRAGCCWRRPLRRRAPDSRARFSGPGVGSSEQGLRSISLTTARGRERGGRLSFVRQHVCYRDSGTLHASYRVHVTSACYRGHQRVGSRVEIADSLAACKPLAHAAGRSRVCPVLVRSGNIGSWSGVSHHRAPQQTASRVPIGTHDSPTVTVPIEERE